MRTSTPIAWVLILIMVMAFPYGILTPALPWPSSQQLKGSMKVASSQTFSGILNIVWGDPKVGSGGETRYSLALSNETVVPLQLTGQDSVAAYYFGKPVTISGRIVPNRFTHTLASSAIVVDTIEPQQGVPATTAGVFGTKKVIYLLLKFSDDSAVPHPSAFYTDLNNPDTPPAGEVFPATVNGFFKKTSWNQFYWIGDVGGVGGVGALGGWLTLPHPKSYYAPCSWSSSCANLQALGNDGTALGRAQGINFKNYDNINFVLSNDLDCCAWGGGYYSSVDAKSYGATWEPPWGQEAGTYSHEMGHSIGLPHSGWVYYAYDNPWDMMSATMSANTVNCGSYYSDNSAANSNVYCTEPGDGYNAAYKDYLGWIPAANEVVTDTSSSVSVSLEADALPLSTADKMIKICIKGSPCAGSSAHYFTVEARVGGYQFDNGLPGEGVIIQMFEGDRPAVGGPCFFNSQSGWAWPIDSTPGDWNGQPACNNGGRSYPNYALFNAQWLLGQTYVNATYRLSVNVVARSGSSFVIAINPSSPGAVITLSPNSGTPGTRVLVSGVNFALGDSGCTISSSPSGLISSPSCTLSGGVVSGSFTVASGAMGSYTVTVTGTIGDSASAMFNVSLISPSPRDYAMTTYDAKDGYVLLFGGTDSNGFLGDTWAFSGGVWTQLRPTASPPGRNGGMMAYDAKDGYVLLFGGVSGTGLLGDTWKFSGGVWTQLNPSYSPPPRVAAMMTYDAKDAYVLLFGGLGSASVVFLADTWRFSGGVWTQLNPLTSPPARDYGLMTYDAKDAGVLLFGGFGGVSGVLGDTWGFRGGVWRQLNPSISPVGRDSSATTYDAKDGGVLLFGGDSSWSPPSSLGDTWGFRGGVWRQLNPSTSPPARCAAAMVYDAKDGYVLLFGGWSSATGLLADTWAFSGGVWTRLT